MNRQCKCTDCGYVFDYEERSIIKEYHGFGDGVYETLSVCPNCGGDFEDAVECHECGEAFTEDEIYGGKWCEKCLRETINYDTFFEYCEANKEHQYLDIFVMQEIFGMDCPNKVTDEWHECIVKTYKERTMLSDMIFSTPFGKMKDKLIDSCIRFIMDDDGSIGRENYADWLNKREVENGKK